MDLTLVTKFSKAKTGKNPGGRIPLLEEDITIAEVLQQAGYVTGITGKWGLGEPGTSGTPNKQGLLMLLKNIFKTTAQNLLIGQANKPARIHFFLRKKIKMYDFL
jgi:arylsulfatase A-like enzyme